MSNPLGKQPVKVKQAFFVKLGRAGQWEKDSIEHGLMRISWRRVPLAGLWWCRLAPGPVEEDATSKFRRTLDGWCDLDLAGRQLQIASMPGTISELQGFRGTVCKVSEVNRLQRLLNGEVSAAYHAVSHARGTLVDEVKTARAELHWKDFEVLVDLLFRQAGRRRLGVLGLVCVPI